MSSKDAEKKQRELARLEQLKQAMRLETESMVEQAKSDVETRKNDIQQIIEVINSAGQELDEAFEGEASEAAQTNVTKLKSKNIDMNTDFEFLVDSFEVY
ncbi:hypothetical protein [Staphylococcus epidermidis]|mgnify:FL=1|uniref:hypothetical protein n=1 Tax=Staphylococcus epidermidis TaxID=1282 RepID=UPI0002433076|nr:hypothetical protein [Staphylococcus epidermidis]EHM71613.1 hypothetical protein HMPREF9956_0567 [Staphylococcus epidermidis 14.1.R1.SE]APT16924.1 hypothetical protein BUM85_08500 [Staphylococcus epidermidis]MCG1173543.1 hypothetical protein [Staphylococcus epidermidis]MDH8713888.1 hypothetical protein [Staphylococcus epidermidis]MEB5644783.1 hypothetical protein [Staphylococcus epidermidis]